MFLDLALEMTGKGALESGLAAVRSAAPSTMLGGLLALLQQPLSSACMSALPGQGGSAALVAVAGQLAMLSQDCPGVCVGASAAMHGVDRASCALCALCACVCCLLDALVCNHCGVTFVGDAVFPKAHPKGVSLWAFVTVLT
jgi:hypothetical protein